MSVYTSVDKRIGDGAYIGATCSGKDHRNIFPLTLRKKTLGTSESISFDKYRGGKYRTERIVTKDEYKPS